MMLFGFATGFWIAAIAAALVRILTSRHGGVSRRAKFGRAAISLFVALFAAACFARPLAHWLGLDPAIYLNPLAALTALTGEGLLRWLIAVANDPRQHKRWLWLLLGHLWRNDK